MKYTKTMLVSIIALILWCGWNTIASNDAVKTSAHARMQQKILLREVSYLTDRLTALEQLEPEVIVKEVIKEVEVPVEVIKEIEVIKEVMVPDTTK